MEIKMKNMIELKQLFEIELKRATESRTKIRKRVEANRTHESHFDFADGLVAGIESSLDILNKKIKQGCENVCSSSIDGKIDP